MDRDNPQNTLREINQYKVVDFIGHGGTSSVYKAFDTQMKRLVAIKLMHSHLTNLPDLQSRFLAEARAIAALEHANIIKIYEVGLCDGKLFLAMEFIEGGTLRRILSDCKVESRFLNLREIVSISRQVAQALHFAHANGIVHRDVKPDNVLLRKPEDLPPGENTAQTINIHAVLTDFGLAKRIDGSQPLTASNELMGTVTYMAPERFRGDEADARADIYSLGIMLYEMVTGRQPFISDSFVDLVRMHVQAEPPRIQDIRPDTPPSLISIIHRAMRKNPKERYQSAREISRELEALEKSIKPNNQTLTWRVKTPVIPDWASRGDRGAATQYDILPSLDRPVVPVDLLGEATDDIIVVTPPEGESWSFPLEKPSLLVGRDPGCDLQLEDSRVSRKHLRIDRLPDGQVVIADQGSLNGLYLDDKRLDKSTMVNWPAMHSVKVGPFWLTLRLAKTPVGVGRRVTIAAPRVLELPVSGRNAVIRLIPAEAVVEPGSAVIVRIEVTNRSADEQFYLMAIQGLPSEWFTIASFQLHAMPGMTAERVITFHPPRLWSSTATNYDYVLTVFPDDDPRQVTMLTGTLQVFPFYAFDSEIQSSDRILRLTITNQGNNPRPYVIEVREPGNKLLMLPSRTRSLIMPGQENVTEIAIRPKHRALIGRVLHYPIELFIRTEGLRPHTQTLDFAIPPRIRWQVALGLLILVTVIGAFLFLKKG